jgi:hypothetical protein
MVKKKKKISLFNFHSDFARIFPSEISQKFEPYQKFYFKKNSKRKFRNYRRGQFLYKILRPELVARLGEKKKKF